MNVHPHHKTDRANHGRRHGHPWQPPSFLRHWYWLYVPLAGALALLWLAMRTGTKPSRLSYPCQQAALSAATAAFGASVVAVVVYIRRRLSTSWWTPAGLALAAVTALALSGSWGNMERTDAYVGPLFDPPADYRAQIFSSVDCPQSPVGDRFLCVEDLLEMMGAQGIKLHRSSTTSLTAGPDGIIGASDVVVIKINYQWPERGGTNTDLLRGLIRRIVDHPDGFEGEVVVAENTQFAAANGLDRSQNNAQDPTLSPHDVVQHFRAERLQVSDYIWTGIRYQSVAEYSAGDMNDGYVVGPYDGAIQGRVSYPKFQTIYGTRISLRYGVWDEVEGYDRERLKLINVPVLKSHHATYGATGMVKHYMGVVTGELSTNSHSAIRYGVLGELIGQIQPADLNILDAVWINANPFDGPWTTYAGATRTDRLVASLDPVAADRWAVSNILIPAFEDNGYTRPWPYPSADPDDPTSAFRVYLDASMNRILAAGYSVTNDFDRMDEIDLGPPGEASDPTGSGEPFRIAKQEDGYGLSWSSPVRGGAVEQYELYRTALASLASGIEPQCEGPLGTAHSASVTTLPAGQAFFVVARNVVGDGSIGRNSRGQDRAIPDPMGICP